MTDPTRNMTPGSTIRQCTEKAKIDNELVDSLNEGLRKIW